jgi:hypothetical protein
MIFFYWMLESYRCSRMTGGAAVFQVNTTGFLLLPLDVESATLATIQ